MFIVQPVSVQDAAILETGLIMEHMHFSNTVPCPEFAPNAFQKDICSQCQSKIQQHSGARKEHIVAALEYAGDKVPSLIWSSEGVRFGKKRTAVFLSNSL